MSEDSRRTAECGVDCEVWWATLSERPSLVQLLDVPERRRVSRLRHAGDRDRFITARALLRLVLAERTGTAPSELHFDTTCLRCGADHGKPRLIGLGSESFSISHSGDRVAVAVTERAPVGVDVETIGSRGAEELAVLSRSILGPAELLDYRHIEESARGRALAAWWTRKEAVLKATGHGLTVPMCDVSVTAPDEPAALRRAHGSDRVTAEMAALHDLTPGEGSAACVAVLGVSAVTVIQRDGDALLDAAGPAERTTAVTLP